MKRIGIYPGTFDPVHAGHLAFAMHAIKACKLDRVVFLPEHTPRHKPAVTDVTHRNALLAVATRETPQLSVRALSSRQFTVHETLPEIRALYGDAKLTLLVGSDVARSISTWHNVDELLGELSLAVGVREGDDVTELLLTLRNRHKTAITPVHTSHAHVSSSVIRSDLTKHDYLHQDAINYIEHHSLYV